jgi:hypothetical protein
LRTGRLDKFHDLVIICVIRVAAGRSAGTPGSGSCERFAGKTSQGADADAARVRALAAYKDFLALWKDADVPILKEAKAEYAKLQ